MLRAANSAASAPVDRVTTAERALMRVGLSATHRIVTGAVVGASFGDLHRAGLDPDELWRHVIACALLADSATRDGADRSSGFTAGLLHDIGRMAFAQGEPERYAEVVAAAKAGENVEDAEKKVFGRDHAEWGELVAREWDIPDEIAIAIGGHHSGATDSLSKAMGDARRVAAHLGYGDGVVPPEVADDAELPVEGKLMLSAVGGEESLNTQIEWFRGALAPAA
jgi:putative nucleotidyltransferase with HDIG domain